MLPFFIRKEPKKKKEKSGFNKLFRGVVFQLSRELQVFAQKADREDRELGPTSAGV